MSPKRTFTEYDRALCYGLQNRGGLLFGRSNAHVIPHGVAIPRPFREGAHCPAEDESGG